MTEFESNKTNHDREVDTEFYKGWVAFVLTEGLSELPELLELQRQFTPTQEIAEFLRYKGFDTGLFATLGREFQRCIDEEVDGAVSELRSVVFEPGLFRVGVVIEGVGRRVQGVVRDGLGVLPIVNGEPYTGEIEQVFFDR